MMSAGDALPAANESVELSIADRWVRSQLGRTLGAVESALREYRFDYVASSLYEFTWYEFCDWYLELTKPVLQADTASEAARRGARGTLLTILEALQRALHPLMPFITEAIWQRVAPLTGRSGPTIMLEPYPTETDFPADLPAEREVAWIKSVINAVRQIRSENGVAPGKRIPVLLSGASSQDEERATQYLPYLMAPNLAGIQSVTILAAGAAAPHSATALVGELTILVPLAGLIDAAAEAERLTKRSAKAQEDLQKIRAKLANESFVRNAPAAVVAGDRERAAELERAIASLSAQLERIRSLL
jgi:valyl-tRNA synthetase